MSSFDCRLYGDNVGESRERSSRVACSSKGTIVVVRAERLEYTSI